MTARLGLLLIFSTFMVLPVAEAQSPGRWSPPAWRASRLPAHTPYSRWRHFKNFDSHAAMLTIRRWMIHPSPLATWPRAESGTEYARILRDFAKWLLVKELPLSLVDRADLGRIGGPLNSILKGERDYRRRFLNRVRVGGYRLETTLFGWKCYTPNGFHAGSGSVPSRYLKYKVDEDTIFPQALAESLAMTIIQAWVEMFTEALEVAPSDRATSQISSALLKSLEYCSARDCQRAAQALKTYFAEFKAQGLSLALAGKYLTVRVLLNPSKAEIARTALLAKVLEGGNIEKLAQELAASVRDCREVSMKSALTLVRELEQAVWAAFAKGAPLRVSPKLVAAIKNKEWLKGADFARMYAGFLDAIRECKGAYNLIRAINFAYEESELAVNYNLQRDLIEAARQAMTQEVAARIGTSVENVNPAMITALKEIDRHIDKGFHRDFDSTLALQVLSTNWYRKHSKREKDVARWLHAYGEEDGYGLYSKQLENLEGRILRFDATDYGLRLERATRGALVASGRYQLICNEKQLCALKFKLRLRRTSFIFVCDLYHAHGADDLERMSCLVFDSKRTLRGKVLLDEVD